jgi:osmotically-inducible protein OsmY
MTRLKQTSKRWAVLAIAIAGAFVVTPVASAADTPLTDQGISDAVEDELLIDDAILVNNVDINTVDGVVTLTGKVDNLLAQQRAARIASTVKGVRSVINKLKVQRAPGRPDEQIQEDIKSSLLMDPAADSYEITARVNDGHATLKGTVDSWQERRLAEKVVLGVRGVLGVTNNIEVDHKVDRADEEIKPEIEQRLKWDTLVDSGLIEVSVRDAHVMLSGTVGSAAEKNQAKLDAWVAGVDSVDATGLQVRDWARNEDQRKRKFKAKSDSAIENAVKDALLWDPRVASFDVTPTVSDGVVTLRGKVDNLKARRAAAQDARNTVGVISVNNRIKVRPTDEISDQEIAANVRDALARDPYIEPNEVSVSVANGVVDLDGEVDSYFERGQADDVAARVNGVILVDNNIEVDDDLYVADPYVDDWYVYDYEWYDYEPDYALLPSDSVIKEEINDELWWSPFVDSDQVEVSVSGGIATLTGTVDTISERRIAAENALEGGAINVINNLIVQ